MKKFSVIGRILSTRYKSTSYYGNPKYYVNFEILETNEVIFAQTANDAACAYCIENSDLKDRCTITYHYTRTGNCIIDFVRK